MERELHPDQSSVNATRVTTEREHVMPSTDTIIVPAKSQEPADHESVFVSPFRTLERLANEVARVFDDFGVGGNASRVAATGDLATWTPRVDITQHNDEILIRADLPGIEKDDVKINITKEAITIRGERHRAQDEQRDAVYRSERRFGAFYRVIELPAAAGTDQAKASLNNGVLEIRMPAAPTVAGRPIEIAG